MLLSTSKAKGKVLATHVLKGSDELVSILPSLHLFQLQTLTGLAITFGMTIFTPACTFIQPERT